MRFGTLPLTLRLQSRVTRCDCLVRRRERITHGPLEGLTLRCPFVEVLGDDLAAPWKAHRGWLGHGGQSTTFRVSSDLTAAWDSADLTVA